MPSQPSEIRQQPNQKQGLGFEIFQKSVWLLSQEASDLVLAFIFTWIALRRLGPEGFGLLTLTQAILNLSSLATFNLEESLIRLVPEFRGKGLWRSSRLILGISFLIKVILALLVVFILTTLAPFIATRFQQPILVQTIRVGCLSLMGAAIAEVGAAACLGLLHPEVRTLMTTLRRLAEVGGLILVTNLRTNVADVVMVLAMADILAATGYSLATFRFLNRDPISKEQSALGLIIKRMWNYALPLFGARTTEVSGRELGKLLLGSFASVTMVGYYNVARLASERLMTLFSQVPLAAVPVISQSQSRPSNDESTSSTGHTILKMMNYQVSAASLIAIIISAIAPQFILIIGGNAYTPAVSALRILSMAVVIWSGIASLHAFFLVRERTVGIFLLNFVQIVFSLALYPFFISKWSANGAAIVDVVGQSATFGVGLFLVNRWFRFKSIAGLRNFFRLTAPAALLVVPFYLYSKLIILNHIWFAIALALYITYLLRLEIIERSSWDSLSKINSPFPILNSTANLFINLLRNYQVWLLSQRRSVP